MNLKKLKEVRKQRKITQEVLSDALGYKGKSGYYMLESGKAQISIPQSLIIKDVLTLNDAEYKEIFLT